MEPRQRMSLPAAELRSPGEGLAWLGGLVLTLGTVLAVLPDRRRPA